MSALIGIGIIGLLFGAGVLISPNAVRDWSKQFDKLIITLDESITRYRFSTGIISLAIGASALFLSYYVKVKYGG